MTGFLHFSNLSKITYSLFLSSEISCMNLRHNFSIAKWDFEGQLYIFSRLKINFNELKLLCNLSQEGD